MGALGQIGSELTAKLRSIHGDENVVASDIRSPNYAKLLEGPFEIHDCTVGKQTASIVRRYGVNLIYNLPALLSATAEKYPQKAFEVNLIGHYQTLEVAKEYNCAVFTPSTIGVFGESTPKKNTPQDTVMRPNTMYGVTKVSCELLSDYYHSRFGVDTRGVRYPGIISHKTFPGGGTTDFAVEIFYEAIKHHQYTSYIQKGTFLDMMYMPDAINAAINLMEADPDALKHRNAYNISAMSIDVEMLASEIRKHIPEFTISYKIDHLRQRIADSWPESIDDSEAREQWNWQPEYNLTDMTSDMLAKIKEKKWH